MLDKIKYIVETIPIEEVKEYYAYFTEYCKCKEEEYRIHLLAKVVDVFKHHRDKGKINETMTFRAINIVAWTSYMNKKYNLGVEMNYEDKRNV